MQLRKLAHQIPGLPSNGQ